jgi:mono/diheme cytochrome c family protein
MQPIFDGNCALSGCHAANGASGGLILDAGQSYKNLVNVESTEVAPDKRVVPGNSGASYLYEKLTHGQPRSGGQMPLGSDPLSSVDIALIKAWIDQGAPATRQ